MAFTRKGVGEWGLVEGVFEILILAVERCGDPGPGVAHRHREPSRPSQGT